MAQKISFSSQFKIKRAVQLPKLTLEHGEKARIAVVSDPVAEYTHTLNKVLMDEHGQALMKTINFSNGGSKEVPETQFVGKYLCTGDAEVLEQSGSDADNCVFCGAAAESVAFEPPRRYVVVKAFKYTTKPNSFAVKPTPFQGEILPWVLSDGRFSKLVEINEEYEADGGLSNRDLNLGPCENKDYQKYDVNAAASSEWQANQNRIDYVKELLESYEVEDDDISNLMGRTVHNAEAQARIREVQDAYDAAFNRQGVANDRIKPKVGAEVTQLFSSKAPASPVSPDVTAEAEAEDEAEMAPKKVGNLHDLLG